MEDYTQSNIFFHGNIKCTNKIKRQIQWILNNVVETLFGVLTRGTNITGDKIYDFIAIECIIKDEKGHDKAVFNYGNCTFSNSEYKKRLVFGNEVIFRYEYKKINNTYILFTERVFVVFFNVFVKWLDRVFITNTLNNKENTARQLATEIYLESVYLVEEYVEEYLSIDLKLINNISLMGYEASGVSCSGIALVADLNEIEHMTFCDCEIDYEHSREIRKLLEISNADYNLVAYSGDADNCRIVGIADKKDVIDKSYIFSFEGSGRWNLSRGNSELIKFEKGIYKSFYAPLDEYLSEIANERVKKLIQDINEKCHHGALVIMCENKDEALKIIDNYSSLSRAYKITECTSNFNYRQCIDRLCSIDGAIIIDKDANCYGIGTILDGIVKKAGTTARGSRFNSSKVFVDWYSKHKGYQLKAFVLSEDGGIDYIV